MNSRDRVVTAMPMRALWTDDGELSAVRGRALDLEAIRELLRIGPVRFVVANLGSRLRWVPLAERFTFWKADAALHVEESDNIYLEDFPDEFAYIASEWCAPGEVPIVLLEAIH